VTSIVLACGNALRGDDGVALYLARRLYGAIRDAETKIVCSHQWLPEQAEDLSRASLAVFIDASISIPPGQIRVQPVLADERGAGVTTHVVSPPGLMTLAREVFAVAPKKAFLVTIGGASFEHGGGLSEPVRAAIPGALKKICELLSRCGA